MLQYGFPNLGPPLNNAERLILQVLHNLESAQMEHQLRDQDVPRPQMPSTALTLMSLISKRHKERLRNHLSVGLLRDNFRSPAPLIGLWPLIDPPSTLRPMARSDASLQFSDFALHTLIPDGARCNARNYLLALPSAAVPLRCIVLEPSGREFCTIDRLTHASLPSPVSFRTTHVRSLGFDGRGKLTVPTVLELQLPVLGAPWELLQRKRFRRPPEVAEASA